jgi:hypothetical protein
MCAVGTGTIVIMAESLWDIVAYAFTIEGILCKIMMAEELRGQTGQGKHPGPWE